MKFRLPLIYHNVMYNLRGGFLVRPLIIALVIGAFGNFLPHLELWFPVTSTWVPIALFPSRGEPGVAQGILSCIAASEMTVVSIVFAILLMTLTLASMQFSPRIIVSFSQDIVTQQTLGIFLGTFLYCLAALPFAHALPTPAEPVLTVLGAILLAVLCVAWLLFFIHHISQAISVNHIVDRIAAETERVIDDFMPKPREHSRISLAGAWAGTENGAREVAVVSTVSGYVRFIDVKNLAATAKASRLRVRALRRVGNFIPQGVPLMLVSPAERVQGATASELRNWFEIGPTRTLQQDVEYGILQIVDIALKAISPAVNDPSTAISCIDQLSRILIRYASREPVDSTIYDPPGVFRVSIPWLGFDRLLDTAFEQIRLYAKSDIAVNLRMLRALADIASTRPGETMGDMLLSRARRIVNGCEGNFENEEMDEMRKRLHALEMSIDPSSVLTP